MGQPNLTRNPIDPNPFLTHNPFDLQIDWPNLPVLPCLVGCTQFGSVGFEKIFCTRLIGCSFILCMTPPRGVVRNNYLGGLGCSRDILNIIHKSIEYKIINFHISSYSCILMNMKNCLVQCRHIKKNIHIKSCLAMIFHEIKFIHYHLHNEIPYNFLLYINYHIICQKLFLHSIVKSCF